jgi:hypothetical protein
MLTSPNRSSTRRTSRRSGNDRAVGYILIWTVRAPRERALFREASISDSGYFTRVARRAIEVSFLWLS